MSRLTPQHWKKLAKAYIALGFHLERETDDHQIYWKDNIGMIRPIVLPKYKEVSVFIIKNNMRSGNISRQELLDNL